MKAAVLREIGKPLVIEDLALPRLSKGQVLIEMQLSAVCHSQQLEVAGRRGPDPYLPHLVGHEGVGVVADVGPGVKKVKVGDQVVLSWMRGLGQVADPVSYTSTRGKVSAGPIATFCETPVISEQCVTPITPPVSAEQAVLAGCAIPTGAGAVWNAMPAKKEGSICLIGMGGVGLAAVCGAVHAGWRQVVAVDLRASRMQAALQLGATHTIDAAGEDLQEAAARITQGRGFDLVLDCSGDTRAMETAVRVAKPRGGKVVIVGNAAAGETFRVDPLDLIRGVSLEGSWGGRVNPDLDIPRLIRLIQEGVFHLDLLMGKRFSLEEVNEAIRALSSGDPGRPILGFPDGHGPA